MVWKLLWDATQSRFSVLLPMHGEITNTSEACGEMMFMGENQGTISRGFGD